MRGRVGAIHRPGEGTRPRWRCPGLRSPLSNRLDLSGKENQMVSRLLREYLPKLVIKQCSSASNAGYFAPSVGSVETRMNAIL